MEASLPVRRPFRLDLTVDALRRLSTNVVDRVTEDGAYVRVLRDERGESAIVAREHAEGLLVRISGRNGERWLPAIERMLGTRADLTEWYQRVGQLPWLARLATELRGLKPPRYPSLWEAACHAIVFQQISIHAASAIMRRTVELLCSPRDVAGLSCLPFPRASELLDADVDALRAAGLSANKVAHLRSVADAIHSRALTDQEIEALATPAAIERLMRVRGIGRWTASVILLRGFARLDVFPPGDSGAARSLRALSGDDAIAAEDVVRVLAPVQGMLYYHLLLGRLRNLLPGRDDCEKP